MKTLEGLRKENVGIFLIILYLPICYILLPMGYIFWSFGIFKVFVCWNGKNLATMARIKNKLN
jgi:hypothetical protein